jgi:hypothetical protein
VAINRTPALIVPKKTALLPKAPPPLGVKKPAPLSARGPSKSDSLKVQQTWDGVTAPCAWDICAADLDPVPLEFPLERTHRSISGADATEVAQRISEALRSHSIEARFDKSPVKAKCKTNDLVSFRIRLYAGGDNGLPVIVEVQRRSGSPSCFMKSCRAILAAAEGKLEASTSSCNKPPTMKSVGQMKCLQNVALSPLCAQRVSQEELTNAVTMIRSEQKDSNALGLENLLSLTDPVKTSPAVATTISKFLVLGDHKEYDTLREDIRSFTDRDIFEDETVAVEGSLAHADRVRHLALSVFANALANCCRDGCLKAALDEQSWFKEHLMSGLVDELKLFETSACSSLQASRCISSLLECCSVSARDCLQSHGVTKTLEEALEYGKISNELLAEESSRCLSFLN